MPARDVPMGFLHYAIDGGEAAWGAVVWVFVRRRWLPGRPDHREVTLHATGPRHEALEILLHDG